MNDTYKLVGEKGPELNDADICLVVLENMYPPITFLDSFTDDTIPMVITVEVRKFWFWWKA
jgi:hypothetical protein